MIILYILGIALLIVVGLFIWYHLTLRSIANKLIEAMVRRDITEMEKISKSKHLPPYTKAAINYHVHNYKEVKKKKNGN